MANLKNSLVPIGFLLGVPATIALIAQLINKPEGLTYLERFIPLLVIALVMGVIASLGAKRQD